MPDTRISDLFNRRKRPLLSFEFFPPKDDAGFESLEKAARQLLDLEPDFVTCTYGAGGSTRERTLKVCKLLRDTGYNPVMPHLTCVGSSRDDLRAIADRIHGEGYRNIMTLRGDPPKGDTEFRPHPDGLSSARELVGLLKERHADFCCGVAAYPEVHPDAQSADADLVYLKSKLDAGGDFATTQLFFDNGVYHQFADRCRSTGITKPVLPGLLPALSLKQVKRMCDMCKASLPDGLARALESAGSDGAAEEAGLDWAVKQVDDLLAHGAPGIHLYILNRSQAAMSSAFRDCLKRRRA